jgi:FAD/FMN-containing dehydrogenase
MQTTTHVQRMLQVAAEVAERVRQGCGGAREIDVSSLSHVLAIDTVACRCVAEPLVTFRDLLCVTLPRGLVPRVVPDLGTITLGEALARCARECFHDCCIEYEVVTGTGDVVRCTREHDPDLFWMTHGAYGTLGILTELTFELIDVHALGRSAAPARHAARVDWERQWRMRRRMDPKNLFCGQGT